MKALALYTLVVLAMALAGPALAANGCGQPTVHCPSITPQGCPCPDSRPCPYMGTNGVCRTCPAPAWDRCPIVVYPYPTIGAGPSQPALVDPWTNCGAFCAASQIPAGWPYGWNSQYWLRPDSNY
jgi:hypothetical protein